MTIETWKEGNVSCGHVSLHFFTLGAGQLVYIYKLATTGNPKSVSKIYASLFR